MPDESTGFEPEPAFDLAPFAEQERLRERVYALEAQRAEALARVASYEHAITWNTSCLGCAAGLDSAYAETVRRETAEERLAKVREFAATGTPLTRAARRYLLAILDAPADLGQPGAGCPA